MRKIHCIFLVLVLLLSLMTPALAAERTITTTPTGYTAAADVEYVTVSDTLVNWGARGEDATFLTTYAESYYTDGYDWNTLSALSGGTGTSDAYSSDLYKALQDMMVARHETILSYQDTRAYYQYTDCVSGDHTQLSSFYSGKMVNGTWDSGKTYNREHTWPNSKGLGGSDEDDIMMLRPTISSENSSRGNTAYGQSSGYFDPGADVRGDCARIVLYVYVRWGNTAYMWGQAGVMESLDVLLKWMEEDPVDTWELGRNDSVESITGVRNVFVDYPEYAWLLFGAEVPENMVTPSGEAMAENAPACTHENTELRNAQEATCAADGYTGDTYCTTCGELLEQGEAIPATSQHSFGDWTTAPDGASQSRTCQVCGHEEEESIAACEHDFGPWETVIKPGNGRPGIQARTCKLCSYKESQELTCQHTNTEVRNKQEAGCKDGYTGDTYCTDCETLVTSGTKIAATGEHIFGAWITMGPESFRLCTLCNFRDVEEKDDRNNGIGLNGHEIMMIIVCTAAVAVIVVYIVMMRKQAQEDKNKKNRKK